MPTPFSSQDLGRVFESRALTRGRTLGLAGGVAVELDGETIAAVVQDKGLTYRTRITPAQLGRRVVFDHQCSCGIRACSHLAATALAALDQFPALRKAEQRTFFDNLVATPVEAERQRAVFEVSPADPPAAFAVTTLLMGERTGAVVPASPRAIAADATHGPKTRAAAELLGGEESRTTVGMAQVTALLQALIESGQARWHASGQKLVAGEARVFASAQAVELPPRSGVIVGESGLWYVDATTGTVAPIRIQPPAPQSVQVQSEAPRRTATSTEGLVIVERPFIPVLRMQRLSCPDEAGRLEEITCLMVEFDYQGAAVPFDDERQFVRADGPEGPVFVRRDKAAEAAAVEAVRRDGPTPMRVAIDKATKARTVLVFRGRDAAECWLAFLAERVPALQALGWRSEIEAKCGPQVIETVGMCDMQVSDTPGGGFSLDLGIEIDGVRQPLLPILMRLRERGGMEAARVVGGEVITSLDDGRILRLPAERIGQLLAIIDDLVDGAERAPAGRLVLDADAAPNVLDLEDLVTARWQDASAIATRLARLRTPAEIPDVPVPDRFQASLRAYQQQGVNWLQHLRQNELDGLLADDMGLGKTAQTIAHIAVEHEAGRLDRPALIIVPTSLVPNWTAELARFAPHLRVVVLHGMDRHDRRRDLAGAHVVITTYTVLSRDIEEMADLSWHVVVLDEAQAIKSPTARATQAVCRLQTRQRLCLSGTPIENNLGELWSLFTFLMPGLLGSRRSFTKRFRSPIEKEGDPVRRRQLAVRIKPFILRRTKAAVATELPPKHTILRRITLAPDQRELYETIRATMHEKVVRGIASRGVAQSQMLVLDALLKLRQVCCDPRLVKLASAQLAASSSKLDDLLEMLTEMLAEGRRVLLFSQFTGMLDLIKPRLEAVGAPFVELRGDTADRAEPVRRFEAGEVPLFLISLKAGGRGLNLISADTVIHYDPWWNPAVEDQASDRAYRIGQTKSVFVYKLIAADTVEDRILDLQERKAALAQIAFGDEGGSLMGMDEEDIDFLFGGAPERLAA